jgi:hypothetical protein
MSMMYLIITKLDEINLNFFSFALSSALLGFLDNFDKIFKSTKSDKILKHLVFVWDAEIFIDLKILIFRKLIYLLIAEIMQSFCWAMEHYRKQKNVKFS